MADTFRGCAHCPAQIKLGFWDFSPINRPYGEYRCEACHGRSTLPAKERSAAVLTLIIGTFLCTLLGAYFELNSYISFGISFPIFAYIAGLIGISNPVLIKYKDPLQAAKERSIFKNWLIYGLTPMLFLFILIALLFKFAPP